jgi:hypothetical protein
MSAVEDTKEIEDRDERLEKMKEITAEVYDAISEAIEELDKDLTFRPKKLLGFEMYPDRIYTFVTTTATIGLTLIQNSVSATTEDASAAATAGL